MKAKKPICIYYLYTAVLFLLDICGCIRGGPVTLIIKLGRIFKPTNLGIRKEQHERIVMMMMLMTLTNMMMKMMMMMMMMMVMVVVVVMIEY